MLQQLQQLPVFANLQKKFDALSSREQLMVQAMGIVAVIVALYFLLWQPAANYMRASEQNLAERQQLLELIHKNRAVLQASASAQASSQTALDSQQLVSTVTNLAKQNQLELKRFEPSGDNKVKVWVDQVSFNSMMAWLTQLQQNLNIRVEQVTIEKSDQDGLVSARLTLSS